MNRDIPSVDDLFDPAQETKVFSDIYGIYLTYGFVAGVQQAITYGTVKVEDVFTNEVRIALKRRAFEHAALAVDTTKDEISALLKAAIDEGQSIPQLARAIRDKFEGISTNRSVLIARTELTGSINDGQLRTFIREGRTKKQWNAVIDGRERPSHEHANGQIVGIRENFVVGGAIGQYPGDPNLPIGELANCRCVLTAAGLNENAVRSLGRAFLRAHGSLENKFVISLHKAFLEQRDRVLTRLHGSRHLPE